jgi:hypothetical protein
MPRRQDERLQDERRREPESEVRRDTAREEEETRTVHDDEHEGGIGEGPLM